MSLLPHEIIELLNLVPHPTCGFVRQTYISKTILPKNALPTQFDSNRAVGSVLYFMISKETQIRLHKISSDQMYHFYLGCPLEVLLLYPDGNSEVKIMGNDLKGGRMPQLFIPANTFHVSRLHEDEDPCALLGTSEWIGVAPQDVVLGEPDKLINQYPAVKDEIKRFTNKK